MNVNLHYPVVLFPRTEARYQVDSGLNESRSDVAVTAKGFMPSSAGIL